MVRHAELIERRRRSGEVADEEDDPFYLEVLLGLC
jgi:hypothetical protein